MEYLVKAQTSYQSNLGQQVKKLEWAGARLLYWWHCFRRYHRCRTLPSGPAFSYWFSELLSSGNTHTWALV
jgi:hypothetical protein